REDLADLHARSVGGDRFEGSAHLSRSSWFRVPCINMRGATDEEEHDAIDVGVSGFLGVKCTGQRQAQRRESTGVQKVPAAKAIAEGYRTRSIQTQHDVEVQKRKRRQIAAMEQVIDCRANGQ